MKIKWNWGTGIVVAMLLFMIFILQFVYRVTFVDKYNHHLVSEEYYEEELHYQEVIDKTNNAAKLKENVKIVSSDKGINILFPSEFDEKKIEGMVYFKRLSNAKLDFNKNIDLSDHSLFIPKDQLVSGKWIIKIDWKYEDEAFMLTETIFY